MADRLTGRRALLGAALTLPLAVVGCASFPNAAPTPGYVTSGIATVAGAFGSILPQIGAATGVSTTVYQEVAGIVAEIQKEALALASADTVAKAQPLVSRVNSDVQAVIAALSGVPLPLGISKVLTAAQVALPGILAAVGIIIAAAPHSSMTRHQAMQILQEAAR